MPTGGEWKEFLRASGDGNLAVIQHHLDQGVDPNWQHPEYFTAPIFEAIRKNQIEAVNALLEGGADPLLMEEMTDCQPLEVALQEKNHDMVDLLSSKLSPEEVAKHVKTMLLSGTTNKEMIRFLLDSGHRILVYVSKTEVGEEKWTETKMMMQPWLDATGNKKWNLIHDLESVEEDIHIWIHYCPLFRDINVNDMASSSKLSNARKVMICNHPPQPPCPSNLQMEKCCVIVEPNSMWYRLTYFLWYETYLHALLRISTTISNGFEGKVCDYQGSNIG